MAQWRKVLVSGSSADVSSLNVGTLDGTAGTIINNSSIAGSRITGSFTGSFVGDGSNLTGITATSLDIDSFGSDLTSATLAVGDLIMVSDGGTDGRANIGDLATPLAGTGLEADSNTIRIATAAVGDGLTGGGGSAIAAGQGTGITVNTNDIAVTAAQTGITSVLNAGLTVGRDSDNVVDFATSDNVIILKTDGSERMRADNAGVDITGALTTTGNITVTGAVSASAGMTGSFTGSFVGDGSNLTGVGFQIDELSNTLTAVAQADLLVVADADATNEEKKITFSNFEDEIFGNVSSDATIAAGGALTIADNAVSLAKMAGLARGRIILGDSSGDPSALDASTDAQILIGDGNDLTSVAVSGDVTISNTGAVTIAADSVEGTMLNTNSADGSTMELSSDSLSVLKVPNALTLSTGLTAAGTFDGAAARSVTVASAQTGIETIYNTALVVGRAANDTTIDFTTDDQIVFDVGSTEALKLTTSGVTVAGDLVVNGSTTTISSTNLAVGDQFIFIATGSAASNVDGGIVVQEGSNVDTGSAFYHDTTDNRWSVAKDVKSADTAVTALEHVVTVKQLGDNDAPVDGDKEYGNGEMAINNDGSIWIYS